MSLFLGALVALGVGIIFILQGIAFFTAGFALGKRSRRNEGSLRDCLPQPLPFGEVNVAVPVDDNPGIAGLANRPVYGMAMPVAPMPAAPPPPPADQIPAPVPPPAIVPPVWPAPRIRGGRNMVRVGILATHEAHLPINRFPNAVYWSENGECYHTRRDSIPIRDKAEVFKARVCSLCRPQPGDLD